MVGPVDLSGLGVALSVNPTAVREGTSGDHTVTATLTGVPVPTADVAMVLTYRRHGHGRDERTTTRSPA